MKEMNRTYYLLWERTVAKREQNEKLCEDYIFRDGKWVSDKDRIVMDHLVGFDPSEPEDSPYRIGSTDVLMEMAEISEKDAIEIMNQQILYILKEIWKTKVTEAKAEWDRSPGWPAKLVKTNYALNGIKCTIYPSDVGLSSDPLDQGFMESIRNEIEADLREYGATDIYSCGFLD